MIWAKERASNKFTDAGGYQNIFFEEKICTGDGQIEVAITFTAPALPSFSHLTFNR
jgi:hypothetical protein